MIRKKNLRKLMRCTFIFVSAMWDNLGSTEDYIDEKQTSQYRDNGRN